jgi:hypothetical protein
MKYKGYELLKAIANGEIKERSRFKAEYKTFIARDGYLFVEYDNRQEYANSFELKWEFELIEDEIDIDSIEKLESVTNNIDGTICMMSKINELVQAVKQINKEVKELKEDK